MMTCDSTTTQTDSAITNKRGSS